MATSGTLIADRAGEVVEPPVRAPAAPRRAIEIRPLVRELPAAWTPDRVAAVLERLPHAVFFESAGPDLESGAWTLLAFDPLWQVEVREGRLRRVLGVGAGSAGPREVREGGARSLPPPRDRGDLGPALQALAANWPAPVVYDPAPPRNRSMSSNPLA
ncbi:MAG: hypothetical protein AABZ94_07700, partial [Candidatus Eisenbacteria bacterium]